MMKQIFSKIIFSAICIVFISVPLLSLGQVAGNPRAGYITQTYKPITPGGLFDTGTSLTTMLDWIFTTSITLAIVLAVLMLIVGGIEYMGSESFFKKDEGKQRMMAALGGLLIALVSILILTTIFGGGESFGVTLFK